MVFFTMKWMANSHSTLCNDSKSIHLNNKTTTHRLLIMNEISQRDYSGLIRVFSPPSIDSHQI